MKKTTSIIFLLSVITSAYGFQTRIFKGSAASEGEYKYHALISAGRGSGVYCGGSIIDKRWILTAAHCFKEENVRKLLVQVGATSRSGRGGAFYRVEKRIPHEDFHELSYTNDIALLRVDRDIEFNDKIRRIRLADKDTNLGDTEYVVFTGFGRDETLAHSSTLKYVVLNMLTFDKCREVEPRITAKQLCTLPINGEGPCKGDSGGPLITVNSVQIGIDSGGYGASVETCGQIPEIYTKVSSYRDWIDQKIRQY